jgi:hypothetical protein
MSLSEEGGPKQAKPVTVKGVVFVTHNHSLRRRELDDMAARPQALHRTTVRLPQTHGLRKCFFCIAIVAIVTAMSIVESIASAMNRKSHNHTDSAACFNLQRLSFKPPFSIPLRTFPLRHELDRIPPKPASGGSSRPGLFENRALCRSSGETQSSATTCTSVT